MSILRPVWRREAPRVRSMDDVARLYADHNIVDRYIRTEQLEEDLAEVLREVGLDGVTAEDLVGPRRNASARRDVAHYYDAATIDLVAREERFVIDRFGYAPPEPRAGEAA
jgi:hypothetical protein